MEISEYCLMHPRDSLCKKNTATTSSFTLIHRASLSLSHVVSTSHNWVAAGNFKFQLRSLLESIKNQFRPAWFHSSAETNNTVLLGRARARVYATRRRRERQASCKSRTQLIAIKQKEYDDDHHHHRHNNRKKKVLKCNFSAIKLSALELFSCVRVSDERVLCLFYDFFTSSLKSRKIGCVFSRLLLLHTITLLILYFSLWTRLSSVSQNNTKHITSMFTFWADTEILVTAPRAHILSCSMRCCFRVHGSSHILFFSSALARLSLDWREIVNIHAFALENKKLLAETENIINYWNFELFAFSRSLFIGIAPHARVNYWSPNMWDSWQEERNQVNFHNFFHSVSSSMRDMYVRTVSCVSTR